jgi:hypothetical protein
MLSLNGQRMKRVLATLLNDGLLTKATQFYGNRPEVVYAVTPSFKESPSAHLDGADEPAEKMNKS